MVSDELGEFVCINNFMYSLFCIYIIAVILDVWIEDASGNVLLLVMSANTEAKLTRKELCR